MTSARRFEQDLPVLLADLYLAGTPDYRDELVLQVARVKQRPAWTFPERWLPVELVTTRVPMTRLPYRQLGVLALIALLLAAMLAVYVGSNQPRLPAPFGVASNGRIAYSVDGDIYTINPTTGQVIAVVTGPEHDSDPAFSPDGTSMAFVRTSAEASAPAMDIVVARSDGSDPMVITPTAIPGGPSLVEWAGDSRSLVVAAGDGSVIWLLQTTAPVEPRVLVTDADPYLRPMRPPDGSAMLIRRSEAGSPTLIRLDLETLRETVLARGAGNEDLGAARWSPDGRQVVYNAAAVDDRSSQRLFIVNADGTEAHQITNTPGTWFDIDATWSPDGSRIAFNRYERVNGWLIRPIGVYSLDDGTVIDVGPLPRDARAKDPSPGDSSATSGEGFDFEWSPDGTSLIAVPGEAPGHPVVIDVSTGTWRNLDPIVQPASTKQSWQRLAP